jgi:hypothetical protein
MFKVTELQPINRKSFYGKALIVRNDNISELKSYNTIVATYNHDTNKVNVKGWYSETTARHINSFLLHFGFDTCTKKQLQNYNN